MFFYQVVLSSPLAGAVVTAVTLQVSQGGGNTPHGGCQMRWMDFNPLWIFWIFSFPHITGCLWKGGGVSLFICQYRGVVTRVTNSSAGSEGVLIRVADSSTSAEGAVIRVAGSSASVDLVGLGCMAFLAPASDVSWVRPLKTSWSLMDMYGFITYLNSCIHITKWHGSLRPARLAFSAQY